MKMLFLLLSLGIMKGLHAQNNVEPVSLYGVASYYHPRFHGRTTANGEVYQHHEFSGASNKILLNKRVRVTDVKNGRTVVVRITDRTSKTNKRVIDLSYAAAKELRMVKQGIRKVKVEILPDEEPEDEPEDRFKLHLDLISY